MNEFNILDAVLFVEDSDFECAKIALAALQKDIKAVGDVMPEISGDMAQPCETAIIVGTLGKSPIIDRLVADGTISVSATNGKRESYVIEAVENAGGAKRAFLVAGSDKRGTAYGIFKISEMLGVSPWVWWGDSVPDKKENYFIPVGFRLEQGEPSVEYRGFFLNDEAPSLSGWVGNNFGKLTEPRASQGYDSEFYAKVFELLLRLKGNYIWPTMWNNSFHTDDPENTALAGKYGIVMGTSHHEHMTCADKEWTWSGLGEWNYATNRRAIYDFWHRGVDARRDTESVITLGMRGQADSAILGKDATLYDNIALLQSVIDDQREIIKKVYGKEDAAPQMIALYKEVEDFYYGDGTGNPGGKLEVPDDVTLMLCDDNFGNLRTLPTEEMLKRSGGFGMYYHLDYRGGPISYEWINQVPLAKIWDNMTTAYDAGIRKIWIINVGDLKPMEFPLEYFMELAYDFETRSEPNKTEEFTKAWAAREFGAEFADDTAAVLSGYTKILGARKAEVVLPSTFSLTAFNEADRVLAEFEAVVAKAEAVYEKLPPQKKGAFYQLVLYSARAAMNTYKTNICAAWSLYFAERGDTKANEYAKMAKEAFEADARDMEYYNTELSGGKWDGIMRQNHIGYTMWDSAKIFPVPSEMPQVGVAAAGGASSAEKLSESPKNYVSINPANFAKNIPAQRAQFMVIHGYGRDGDSVKVLPNGKSFAPGSDAPMLQYDFTIDSQDDYAVNVFIAPANPPRNIAVTPTSEQLRFSVQLDETKRKTVSGLPKGKFIPGQTRIWELGVMDNTRIIHVPCGEIPSGRHTLRIFAVDPCVVIQKIVIAPAAETPKMVAKNPYTTHFMGSFFGPPTI